MKYTLLVDVATSQENNKGFSKYDTTINVYVDNIQQDGFIGIKAEEDTDTYYISKVKEFYKDITLDNCEVIRG